jgi:hypothetical protein
MNFKNFSELREFIRCYNSTSILEVGTKDCWQRWETKYPDPSNWVLRNAARNYAVRLMLLASAGNPHRRKNISIEVFDNLINAYYNLGGHTISDKLILDNEAEVVLSAIQKWEIDNDKIVRNWSLKLSDILNLEFIRKHVASLFVQRQVTFQNAGYGSPSSRIKRTIKFIELLDKHSSEKILEDFSNCTKLTPIIYFRQFLGCLSLFNSFSKRKGFCNFHQLPNMDNKIQSLGITPENIEIFVKQNSASFSTDIESSFRNKVNHTLNNIPEFYQPFFCNKFLDIPFIELGNEEFCLPDPFSFTESCWNQVRGLMLKRMKQKELENLLSYSFETYLENVLFPIISPNSFEKIPEIKNPTSKKDKRADFLIKTSSSYIVLECKSSVMSANTSAYFQPNEVANLWCRIHSASEQISATIKALNLHDKPVIPLVITFYDSMTASSALENMLLQTNYCSCLGLNMPPIVHSLHEFEHSLSKRSLNNWAESILLKQNNLSIKPDNKGHNYEHLKDVPLI